MNAFYIIAIISGFLGGFSHCTFMCGPIISSVVLNKIQNFSSIENRIYSKDQKTNWIYINKIQILYHAGRIFTYSFIGFIMGTTGSFINTITSYLGISNFIFYFVCIFMIVKGLEMLQILSFGVINNFFNKIELMGFRLSNIIVYFKNMNSVWKFFLYGMVLGLIPCGLSYTAFITSAGLENGFKGFLFMFLFGISNIPSLYIIVSFSSRFINNQKSFLYKFTGVILIFSGIFFIVQKINKFL